MTDRELLELAAKAAGIEVAWHSTNKPVLLEVGGPFGKVVAGFWNPLTDDGDALRLAVKRGVFDPGQTYAQFRLLYVEEINADRRPSEAMRRAIVRAVAAIGKSPASQPTVCPTPPAPGRTYPPAAESLKNAYGGLHSVLQAY